MWLAELLADALADYRALRAKPKHAAFAISAWKRLAKLLTESGLTPRGRVGLIAVPQPGGEVDAVERLLRQRSKTRP